MKSQSSINVEPFFSYDLFHLEDMVHSASDPMDICMEIENYIDKLPNNYHEQIEISKKSTNNNNYTDKW